MKRQISRLFIAIFVLFFSFQVMADEPGPPPPPGHARNGNQVSPGGTGCPLDRKQGLVLSLALSLAYAGFVLYRRGSREAATL